MDPASEAGTQIGFSSGTPALILPALVILYYVVGYTCAKRGVHTWQKVFEIEVVPTEIKDPHGNVIRVVG